MKYFLITVSTVAVVAGALLLSDVICKSGVAEELFQSQIKTKQAEVDAAKKELFELRVTVEKEREEFGLQLALLEGQIAKFRAEANCIPEIEIVIGPNTARVLDLPEDGDHWYTTLFLDANYDKLSDPKLRAAQVNALRMFNTEPWCLQLRQETHWNVLKTNDPRAKPFFPIVQKTPCLLIQRACGEVIYKESGSQLSKGPDGLRRALKRATRRHCPDGKCPVAWPTPKAEETPKEEPIPAVIEKTPEAPAAPPEAPPAIKPRPNVIPALVAGALACAVAIAIRLRVAVQS